MTKVDIFAIKGITAKDDKAIMSCSNRSIEMQIDEFGMVYNEGGQYIANAKEVESGNGIGCNYHGGQRPGAGRKSTGRKRHVIYVTDEEMAKIKDYIEYLRSTE